MKAILRFVVALSSAFAMLPATAALNVFACEPEWGALAQELGGDKVSVYLATTALQDPHRIEARPSLIARIRSTDLLICSGSELEIGWIPLLLTQSGNPKVQLGSPGYFEASQYVIKLEVPKVIDRSLGDLHPGGNPHVHTDPRNIARIAQALEERMVQIDPANAETYRSRSKSFLERWRAALARWEQQAAPLKGVPIVVYHKDFSYFQPAKVVVYSPYNSPQAAEFLSSRTNIAAVMMPFTVGGTDKAKDLFGLFDDTIGRLLAVVK